MLSALHNIYLLESRLKIERKKCNFCMIVISSFILVFLLKGVILLSSKHLPDYDQYVQRVLKCVLQCIYNSYTNLVNLDSIIQQKGLICYDSLILAFKV